MQSAAAQLRSPGSTVTLNDRNQLPCLGLGVFKAEQAGDACKNAVLSALKLGYRHIDTAQIYQNEEACGAGLKESGLPRESVFVTSKVCCCGWCVCVGGGCHMELSTAAAWIGTTWQLCKHTAGGGGHTQSRLHGPEGETSCRDLHCCLLLCRCRRPPGLILLRPTRKPLMQCSCP